jgi:hypothetical protein
MAIIEFIQGLDGDDGSGVSVFPRKRNRLPLPFHILTHSLVAIMESLRDPIHPSVQLSERHPTIGYHPAGKDSQPSQIENEWLSQGTHPYNKRPLFYTIFEEPRENDKQM